MLNKMAKREKIKIFLEIFTLTFLMGCGYALVGTGKSLPTSIKTIAVPMFQNYTQRIEIEKIVTSAVTQELIRRGVKVVEREEFADAILKGVISSYSTYPTTVSPDARATKYGITVVVRAQLLSSKGEEIYPNSELRFTDEYDLREGTDYFSAETERLRKLSEQIAKSIVSLILEGF
jgi:outer membrane lipopolysaccharide assembly protein LptE/RlpB